MFKQVFFICILLLSPVHSRRSSGGGSFSSSRGSSGARQNVGAGGAPGGFNPQSNQGFHPQPNSGFHPQPNPGFQPNQGGFRPQPNQGFGGQHPGGGFNQGGGFNNNRGFGGGTSHFVPGNGMGSAKSGSSFKTALAGAALGTIGGLAAFELGKAIISSASTPIHHNNKDYYWGQEYHQQKPGEIRCAMPLNDLIQNVPAETTTPASGATTVAPDAGTTTPSPNQLLTQLQFANGTRPKEIVWSCKQGTEICCGTDCCAAPIQQNNNMNNPNGASSQGGSGSSIFGIILGVLLVIALLACCCCFAVYKLCRSSLDSCLPSSNRQEEHYYEDGQKYEGPSSYGNSYPLQPTQYSNQPYSNQPYPQQQQQYPQQPQQYPPHPENQGYYNNQQKY